MIARFLVVISLVLALSLAAVSASPPPGVRAPGKDVHVIDGDTIEIGGRVIDLYGVDAPELGQICAHDGTPWQCGLEAAFILRKLLTVEHDTIVCRPWPRAGSGSTALCEAGSVDLARSLISSGYVVVPQGSFPDYVDLEKLAKDAAVGLWRGRFVPPPDWRAGKRLNDEKHLHGDIAACPVKAVFDSVGRKVYLVPTDAKFQDVHVAPERGERCFSSDVAARAAGWRRRSEHLAARRPS